MSKIRSIIFGVSFFLGLTTTFIMAGGVDGRATESQIVTLFVISLVLFGVAVAARLTND